MNNFSQFRDIPKTDLLEKRVHLQPQAVCYSSNLLCDAGKYLSIAPNIVRIRCVDEENKTETHEASKIASLSEVILGGQDGLVNVLGVILGVAAASHSIPIILAGGLAATFAESISMAAVAYTSKMADKSHYESELAYEKRQIENNPKFQKQKVHEIYKAKGFTGEILNTITDKIISDKHIWLTTIMREGHGITPMKTKRVLSGSATVGVSALIGSLIPLIPFFFMPINQSITISIIISALTLFTVGYYKAKVYVGSAFKSGLEIAVIGMGAAIIGYGIGIIFQHQ